MRISKLPTVVLISLGLTTASSFAASSLANSLKSFTGNSQADRPGQPATLNGSGLNVTFVWPGGDAAWETIAFDTTGATFGTLLPTNQADNRSRNYLRTNETDYHTNDFTAFVTVNRTARESVYFGMGTANYGAGMAPDIGTGNASVLLDLQDGFDNASTRILGGTGPDPDATNVETDFTSMNSVLGLMRLRMTYSALNNTVDYAIDYDPSGAFVADQTLPQVDVSSIRSEWNNGENSAIYFGTQGYVDTGARVGMTMSDFEVVVVPEPSVGILASLVVDSRSDSPQTEVVCLEISC